AGIDFADYSGATGGVVGSLVTPSNNTGDAAGDTYVSIEGLVGSDFDDALQIGNGGRSIWANAGNDTLDGGAGNDDLNGGTGGDAMAGGAGDDIYMVDDAADQVIEAAGQGNDLVQASATFALGAGQEVESLRVYGSAGLTQTGNELNNQLIGGAAGDTLNGAGGNDYLEGGLGNDALNGGAGNDNLNGGAGADAMTGG